MEFSDVPLLTASVLVGWEVTIVVVVVVGVVVVIVVVVVVPVIVIAVKSEFVASSLFVTLRPIVPEYAVFSVYVGVGQVASSNSPSPSRYHL